jgi:hypothetical protein
MATRKKYSRWFLPAQKPWEPGVYEFEDLVTWFRRWDGKHWYRGGYTPEEAAASKKRLTALVTPIMNRWRGLAAPPTR